MCPGDSLNVTFDVDVGYPREERIHARAFSSCKFRFITVTVCRGVLKVHMNSDSIKCLHDVHKKVTVYLEFEEGRLEDGNVNPALQASSTGTLARSEMVEKKS